MPSTEERSEAIRHDRKYRNVSGHRLNIDDWHWQKYDRMPDKSKIWHCHPYAVKLLGNVTGKRILDLGCGTGDFSVILAKMGADVEGLDISPVAIELAKERAVVNGVESRTNFQIMSVYELAYDENTFDMIIGLSILHHVKDKHAIVEPLVKVLKPAGKIVFREPFGNCLWLERLRLLVPVPVNEEDETHWHEQIKYEDLSVFRKYFDIKYKEFQLFSRFDRVILNQTAVEYMGKFDLYLLKHLPFLRPLARDIVIELVNLKT